MGPAALSFGPRKRARVGGVAVGLGFLGGFTTMSTVSFETVALVQGGQPSLAAGDLALTGVLGLGGAGCGGAGAG